MKERRYLSTWRRAKAEQRYRDLDAALWRRTMTGPPPETIDVATGFGPTRVYRWPGDGPPVVFLHGMGDTSIRWIPYAERLDGFDVYAIDIMGDVGASKPTIGFTAASDYTDWLAQTIGGLGLTGPTMVGHSLGGYLVLAYAMTEMGTESGTDPVASVVAFDPVGVVKLRLGRFIASGVGMLLGYVAPGPIRRALGRRLGNPLLLDREALRLFVIGQRDHPPKLPPLPVFTGDQLASITSPLRVLVGARTSHFDVRRLAERIITTVPGAEARLVPGARHELTVSHLDDCLAAVRAALTP